MRFVEAIGQFVASLPAAECGWLAGLRDPQIGRALALLHERPAEPWTAEMPAAGYLRGALASVDFQ